MSRVNVLDEQESQASGSASSTSSSISESSGSVGPMCGNVSCPSNIPHPKGDCEVIPGLKLCSVCCYVLQKMFPDVGKKCSKRGRSRPPKEQQRSFGSRLAGLGNIIAGLDGTAETVGVGASAGDLIEGREEEGRPVNPKPKAPAARPRGRPKKSRQSASAKGKEDVTSEESGDEDDFDADSSGMNDLLEAFDGDDVDDELIGDDVPEAVGTDAGGFLPDTRLKRKRPINPFYGKDDEAEDETPKRKRRATRTVKRKAKSRDLAPWAIDDVAELQEILIECGEFSFWDASSKALFKEAAEAAKDHLAYIRCVASKKRVPYSILDAAARQKTAIIGKIWRLAARHVPNTANQSQMAPLSAFIKEAMDKPSKELTCFPVRKPPAHSAPGIRSNYRNASGQYGRGGYGGGSSQGSYATHNFGSVWRQGNSSQGFRGRGYVRGRGGWRGGGRSNNQSQGSGSG
jgi:hypothetical protein